MAGYAEALKERYKRFSQGDLEGALDLWTDDFVWEGTLDLWNGESTDADAPAIPGSGRHEGRQAAIEALQQALGAWDRFELTPDEFVEHGHTVLMLGRVEVAKDERVMTLPVLHICRFRDDGRQGGVRILMDIRDGAQLLGIE